MSKGLEEWIEKILLIAVFGFLLLVQFVSVSSLVHTGGLVELWSLNVVSQFITLIFLALVVVTTIRRLSATHCASGIEPRLTAVGGTFLLMALAYLPTNDITIGLRVLATLLMIAGTALSIYCLLELGRSFAILPSARQLVTVGAYAFVRHPLYAAEAVTTIGIILNHFSLAAVLVGIAQLALQIRRMHNEERVLREAFQEYASYAARVPMILPNLQRTLARAD